MFCYKAFYANCKNAREFVKLFYQEGRRQYDSQQSIFKFESQIKSIMGSSNPATAGKFYEDNYVTVKSDQIIIRSNIKTMINLQKNIQEEHMDIKEHLNSLYAKNGNVKQGQDCAKSFDEQMITQLIEQEERVKNILEFLKKKEDMCANMFKRPRNRTGEKNKKRKEQRAENKFKDITELISADTSQPIIADLNVEGVVSLTCDQIRYLKEMAKDGKISEKALSTIEEYIPGLLEENGQLSVPEEHQSESTGSESESDLEQ